MSADQLHLYPKKSLLKASDPEAPRKVGLVLILLPPLFVAKRCVRVLLVFSASICNAISLMGAHFAKDSVSQHLWCKKRT